MRMQADYIWIITEATEEADLSGGQKGWGEGVRKRLSALKEVKLSVTELEQNINQFLQVIGRLFKQIDTSTALDSRLELDEVELSVEISAEGEVKLIAGGKASTKGGLTFRFKRADRG